MIHLEIHADKITASGLTPGEDIILQLDSGTYLIHRDGLECHAHKLGQKGEKK